MTNRLFFALICLCSAFTARPQSNGPANSSAAASQSQGNVPSSGQILCHNFENIRCVDQYPGSDWGSRLAAASADLDHAGQLWVSQLAGPQNSSPIDLRIPGQRIVFVEGGTYSSSQTIVLSGAGTGIDSLVKCGQGDFNTPSTCPVLLQEADGANLPEFIKITGPNVNIREVQIDGNKRKQTPGSAGIGIHCQGLRCTVENAPISNFITHNFQATSVRKTANADAWKIFGGMIWGAGSDGIYCVNSNDGEIGKGTELENNGHWGLEINSCGGVRVQPGVDISGNGIASSPSGSIYGGVTMYGVYPSGKQGWSAYNNQLIGVQFGFNNGPDINILGWDTQNQHPFGAGYNLILGNTHISLAARAASPEIDAIHLEDTTANIIEAENINFTGGPGTHWRYGINSLLNPGHASGRNNFIGNAIRGPGFSVAAVNGVRGVDVFEVNDEGLPQTRIAAPFLVNGDSIWWADASGMLHNHIALGGNNTLYLLGHPTQKQIGFQPNPGTTRLTVTDSVVSTAAPIQINGGSPINAVYKFSGAQLNSPFTSIGAGSCQDQIITVAGAATTGTASVSPTTALGPSFTWSAAVFSANTVSVHVCSGATATPNPVTWNVTVIQ